MPRARASNARRPLSRCESAGRLGRQPSNRLQQNTLFRQPAREQATLQLCHSRLQSLRPKLAAPSTARSPHRIVTRTTCQREPCVPRQCAQASKASRACSSCSLGQHTRPHCCRRLGIVAMLQLLARSGRCCMASCGAAAALLLLAVVLAAAALASQQRAAPQPQRSALTTTARCSSRCDRSRTARPAAAGAAAICNRPGCGAARVPALSESRLLQPARRQPAERQLRSGASLPALLAV